MHMKKYLSFVFLVLLSLTACAKKPVMETQPPQASQPAQAPAQTAETKIEEAPPVASAGQIKAGNTEISLRTAGKLEAIYFDYDSFVLTAAAQQVLEKNAKILRENPAEKIVIQGHTDERGSDAYNLALGERRARAAYNYLVALGIPDDRLTIISYGEEQPAAAGNNEESWAKNRRAQF